MDDARLDQPDARLRAIRLQLRNLEQTPIRGRRFIRKRVHADGRRFERCCFDHCTIVVELGVFSALHCTFDGCEYEFTGPAARAVAVADDMTTACDDEPSVQIALRAS